MTTVLGGDHLHEDLPVYDASCACVSNCRPNPPPFPPYPPQRRGAPRRGARSATRRRGLQVSSDDGERKAFHADEINDASQGTFWRFE